MVLTLGSFDNNDVFQEWATQARRGTRLLPPAAVGAGDNSHNGSPLQECANYLRQDPDLEAAREHVSGAEVAVPDICASTLVALCQAGE